MKTFDISTCPTEAVQLSDWANLPDGLAGRFINLLLHDPRAARLSCKLWAREAASFRKHLCVSGPGPKGWLSRFHNLESLHWARPRRDGTTRRGQGLGRLSTLRLLELSDMSAGVLPKLQIPDTLEGLSLDGCRNLVDNDLVSLSPLTQLKVLDLTRCRRITNRGLVHLKTLTGLQFLNIKYTQITDIKELVPLKSLQLLFTFDCRIPDDRLYSELPNFSNLDSLLLDVETNSGAALQGALERLPALRNLGITSNPIREEHTDVLQHLPNLEMLWLQHCTDIGHVAVALIARKLSNLSVLGLLGATRLTDASAAELGRMTRLKRLYISHSPMTDAGLSELRHLTGLVQLELTFCDHITDAGLLALRPLIHLDNVRFEGCDNITDGGVTAFTQVHE